MRQALHDSEKCDRPCTTACKKWGPTQQSRHLTATRSPHSGLQLVQQLVALVTGLQLVQTSKLAIVWSSCGEAAHRLRSMGDLPRVQTSNKLVRPSPQTSDKLVRLPLQTSFRCKQAARRGPTNRMGSGRGVTRRWDVTEAAKPRGGGLSVFRRIRFISIVVEEDSVSMCSSAPFPASPMRQASGVPAARQPLVAI